VLQGFGLRGYRIPFRVKVTTLARFAAPLMIAAQRPSARGRSGDRERNKASRCQPNQVGQETVPHRRARAHNDVRRPEATTRKD
jgi:hypothetical protein